MEIDTGRSGRAKPPASGEGALSPASGTRSSTISRAESSATSTTPRSSADRLQSSTTPSSVIQIPASSAIVNRSIVARDDSAPSKPVITTARPAPERLSSRSAVR